MSLKDDSQCIMANYYYKRKNSIAVDDLFYRYATDVRGSTSSILKSDSTANHGVKRVRDFSYDAYGETSDSIQSSSDAEMDEIAFTGGVYDAETGLYYLMSRYYDPAIAQFISEDSYRGDEEHFWNLYMYCEGDPVNNVDREGHKKKKSSWAIVRRYLYDTVTPKVKFANENITEDLIKGEFKYYIDKTLKIKKYKIYSLTWKNGIYSKKYVNSFRGYHYGKVHWSKNEKKDLKRHIIYQDYVAGYTTDNQLDKDFVSHYNNIHHTNYSVVSYVATQLLSMGPPPVSTIGSILSATSAASNALRQNDANGMACGYYGSYTMEIRDTTYGRDIRLVYFRGPGGIKNKNVGNSSIRAYYW